MTYIVGAYALSPSHTIWDEKLESQYYSALKAMPNVKGIEHPFINSLHPHDDSWFLNNISPEWDFIFTTIPGVMGAISKDASFGIASDSPRGRQAALHFYNNARLAILKLNNHLGKQAVKAIEIHTSPNQLNAKSSAESFQESLTTMLAWNWDGAQIVIEHCDAFVQVKHPRKAFYHLRMKLLLYKKLIRNTRLTQQ